MSNQIKRLNKTQQVIRHVAFNMAKSEGKKPYLYNGKQYDNYVQIAKELYPDRDLHGVNCKHLLRTNGILEHISENF